MIEYFFFLMLLSSFDALRILTVLFKLLTH
jgi:hypothetical protein